MSVDSTSYYDSLLASSDTSTIEYTTTEEATSLTSEDFLTLLVTELQYQDPTDPMDNVEMVNQLTQYSQLEELVAMNESMADVVDTVTAMSGSSGLNYIGMEVEADGNTVTKSEDGVTTLYYYFAEDATTLTYGIYDSSGQIVDSGTASDVTAGSYSLTWDGNNYDGSEADDGTYTVLITAENSEGEGIDISTTTTGTVTGVSNTDDGVILILDDDRTVNMLDVTYATN